MTGAAPFHAEVASAPEGARAVWLTTADGVRIRSVTWSGGRLGTAVLFPGRTEFAEKYGRVATELQAMGLSVAVIDWRGQGLSDRHPDRPMLGHVNDFRDYQHDVAAFLDHLDGLDLPRPWILVSHSMGGAIALRTLMDRGGFEAAVFSAPMWRLHMRAFTREISAKAFQLAQLLGQGARLTPGARPLPTATFGFEKNALTGDRESFDWMLAQITAHTDLALGGPSMQWTRAAFEEMARLQRRPLPEIPALVLLGSEETVVAPAAIRARAARWPTGRVVNLPGARHEVFMERPEIRARVFEEIRTLHRNLLRGDGDGSGRQVYASLRGGKAF